MPKDKFGVSHLNQQRADAVSRRPGQAEPKGEGAEPKGEKPGGGTGNSTTLHDHGDGTFSTDSGGVKTEHPHIGHALVHMGSKHAGGKHMHAHKSSHGITTHKASEQGQVEGPNEHDGADSAMQDMASSMGDDEGAEGEDPRMSHMSHDDGSGLTGF